MNRSIRVLVANRPKVMREALLGTLSDQPWIEVVGEVSNDADIPDHVLRTVPDLLVIAVDSMACRDWCKAGRHNLGMSTISWLKRFAETITARMRQTIIKECQCVVQDHLPERCQPTHFNRVSGM